MNNGMFFLPLTNLFPITREDSRTTQTETSMTATGGLAWSATYIAMKVFPTGSALFLRKASIRANRTEIF